MTHPIYRLSNRQAKELLVRGQQLTIYLPCPAVPDPGDARDFARSSLDVEQHIVDDADWLDVPIQPGCGGEGAAFIESRTPSHDHSEPIFKPGDSVYWSDKRQMRVYQPATLPTAPPSPPPTPRE